MELRKVARVIVMQRPKCEHLLGGICPRCSTVFCILCDTGAGQLCEQCERGYHECDPKNE